MFLPLSLLIIDRIHSIIEVFYTELGLLNTINVRGTSASRRQRHDNIIYAGTTRVVECSRLLCYDYKQRALSDVTDRGVSVRKSQGLVQTPQPPQRPNRVYDYQKCMSSTRASEAVTQCPA